MDTNWNRCDHLRSGYETARPQRMLLRHGGCIRGLLSLQVPARMESLFARHYRGDELTRGNWRGWVCRRLTRRRWAAWTRSMPSVADQVGQALAERVDLRHFGSFVDVRLVTVS